MSPKTSTLRNVDESQAPLCAYCQKPATFQCPGCEDAPILDDADKTALSPWYCSRICQAFLFSRHKEMCGKAKKRKLLYRAGELLQELFYVYRENLFPNPILKIREPEDGSLLFLYDESREDNRTNMDLVERFKSELLSNEDDKKAVLCFRACYDAAGWMDEVVDYVLKGIGYDILECTIEYGNPDRVVSSITLDGVVEEATNRLHEILCVKIKGTREEYVIDITGAQFGQQQAVFKFIDYYQAHVIEEVHQSPLGNTRSHYMPSIIAPGGESNSKWKAWLSLNPQFAPEYKKAVMESERLSGLKVKEILGSSREDFLVAKKVLLNNLDVAMKARLKILSKRSNEVREAMGFPERISWIA